MRWYVTVCHLGYNCRAQQSWNGTFMNFLPLLNTKEDTLKSVGSQIVDDITSI